MKQANLALTLLREAQTWVIHTGLITFSLSLSRSLSLT